MGKQMLKKSTRKMIDLSANWLLVVGGLNWALGIFDWNLVQWVQGMTAPFVGTLIYAGIGIASLWIGGRMVLGKFLK